MGHVAHEGRTIIFVSHSMPTVLALCTRALWLNAGELVDQGSPPAIVRRYLASHVANETITLDERDDRSGDGSVRLTSLRIENADSNSGVIQSGSSLKLVV